MIKELFSNEINVLDYSVHVKGVPQDIEDLPTAKLYVSSTKEFPTSSSTLTVTEDTSDPDIVGRFKVSVPQNLLAKYRYAKVVFEYELTGHGTVQETDIFNVAQRLISFADLNYIRGEDETGADYEVSFDQYNIAETEARHIIQSYCNQEFTYWQGAIKKATGKTYIPLPQYMESLDSVAFSDDSIYQNLASSFVLSESGFVIYSSELHPRVTMFSGPREENSIFATVTGTWGYESIPMAVQQAAAEMINYILSDDIDHRRRYYQQVTNRGSQNFTFHWTSYQDSTGNPLVDDLLKDYRIFSLNAI
jgi:hypothetical protein